VPHPEGIGSEDVLMGAEIRIYSAHPPWRDKLPRDIDETNYQESSVLVDSAIAFSRTNGCDLDFFMDGVFVGQILHGTPDKLLAHGLLGEWRTHLYP
jgi:hypothetical protein